MALKEAERRLNSDQDRPSESDGDDGAQGSIEFMENMFDGLDFGPMADDADEEPEDRSDDE